MYKELFVSCVSRTDEMTSYTITRSRRICHSKRDTQTGRCIKGTLQWIGIRSRLMILLGWLQKPRISREAILSQPIFARASYWMELRTIRWWTSAWSTWEEWWCTSTDIEWRDSTWKRHTMPWLSLLRLILLHVLSVPHHSVSSGCSGRNECDCLWDSSIHELYFYRSRCVWCNGCVWRGRVFHSDWLLFQHHFQRWYHGSFLDLGFGSTSLCERGLRAS